MVIILYDIPSPLLQLAQILKFRCDPETHRCLLLHINPLPRQLCRSREFLVDHTLGARLCGVVEVVQVLLDLHHALCAHALGNAQDIATPASLECAEEVSLLLCCPFHANHLGDCEFQVVVCVVDLLAKELQVGLAHLPIWHVMAAKLHALHARLALPHALPTSSLARCLVDKSVLRPPHNESLAVLGNEIGGFVVTEHLAKKFPRLPGSIIGAALRGYVGNNTLASLGREWGVEANADEGSLQFKLENKPQHATRPDRSTEINEIYADMVRAVFGTVHVHGGMAATSDFVHKHALSRYLDLPSLFRFSQPTRELSRLCERLKLAQPVSRLVSETGRLSRAPVFNVEVFAGVHSLGQGAGASLAEAKVRAAVNALIGYYIYTPSSDEFMIEHGSVVV